MEEQEPCPCCEAETPAKVEITVVPYDENTPCVLDDPEFCNELSPEELKAVAIEIAADPTEADWSEKPKPKPQPVTANMRRRANRAHQREVARRVEARARLARLDGIKGRMTARERRRLRQAAAKAAARENCPPRPHIALEAKPGASKRGTVP